MNKTVLIIDDDHMLRNTLAKGLRSEGFATLDAQSAEAGADILQKVKVDAIVLDRMMTGMDGLGFLKSLRSAGDQTPILMLTALSGPENAIDGLSGGANDYLAKPFQLKELVLRLNNIIKTSAVADTKLPDGLACVDNEFFVIDSGNQPKLLGLSGEEKKLMQQLLAPMGNSAPAAPMVAKRLRTKLNGVLSNIDIITMRGKGYKLVQVTPPANKGEL
ncbi:MAG: response regulator transcription factor [Rickettsiales bacterium]|jgi:DNA-binding response OmpR family regulator|nr:response regulator transcription factor [Rickettsiales bacterium]